MYLSCEVRPREWPEAASSGSLLHQAAFPSLAQEQPLSERWSRNTIARAVCSCGEWPLPPWQSTERLGHRGCQAGMAGKMHERGRGQWLESRECGDLQIVQKGAHRWWRVMVSPGEVAGFRNAYFPVGSQTRWPCQSYIVIFIALSLQRKELRERVEWVRSLSGRESEWSLEHWDSPTCPWCWLWEALLDLNLRTLLGCRAL